MLTFKPNGTLNISTAASDLTETKGTLLTEDTGAYKSEQMSRCKNLVLDRKGMATTRKGTLKYNTSLITNIHRIIVQNGVRCTFADNNIYINETSVIGNLTSDNWSGILYNAYNDTAENIFALNGVNRKRIEHGSVYEWGIDAPTTAPTIVAGASTGLTGLYNACYTYCRKVDSVVVCESNPSDAAAAAVDLNNNSLSITWTASTDAQVTHVRIYRTLTGGEIYYHDQDVAIGTVTLDTTTADGSLGSEVASDHDRPPLGSFVAGPDYNGTCFIAKNNLLYYCKPKQPEYWPATYYIEPGPPQFLIQCIVFYGTQPYILTKYHIYQVQGTAHDSFFPYNQNAVTGAVNPNAACSRDGHGIYHVGTDGIYLFVNGKDTKITQLTFDPIFNGITVEDMPAISTIANCFLLNYGNKLLFGYTSTGHTYPSNIIRMNVDTEEAAYYSYPFEIRAIEMDLQNGAIIVGDTDGYVRRLDIGDTDDGIAIPWEIQSKEFTLQARSHFPRWCKYDVDASDENCTASGKIVLDGNVLQSHTLTGGRNKKKRLVSTGNGTRLAFRVTGTGPVTIYSVEGE